MYMHKEGKQVQKMVQEARVGNDHPQVDNTEAGVILQLLRALQIFICLTNKGILGMMGVVTLSCSKARTLLRVTLASSTNS
jgi:hypothetical protein